MTHVTLPRAAAVCILAAMLLAASTVPAAEPPAYTQRPRIIAVNYDPILRTQGNQRLHEYYSWGDPNVMTTQWVAFMADASHNILQFRISKQINADFWPVKADGFRYTEAQYLANDWHSPDGVDYRTIIRNYDLARKRDRGEVDEVMINGAPYFGYWESLMVGKNGYWCNSSPLKRSANAMLFVIIGWNYERWTITGHAYGHRAESIMTKVYDGWSTNGDATIWDRFGWNIGQTTISSIYGIGSAHYPCNGDSDYDYGNAQTVTSYAPDWLNNFPSFTGETASVNRNTWGSVPNGYEPNYFKWWYQHMPHVDGRNTLDGIDRLNNWWGYIEDFNRWPESGGEMIGTALPATLPGPLATRITNNSRDDFSPRINASGRLVWSGFDGTDFEIYSCNLDGSGLVKISHNELIDEAPQINAAGRVVWQQFRDSQYEIYSANADGTDLTRITNNETMDWHPQINDAGRIVWDHFDGDDLEIYSANADGTDVVQITDNAASSGMPTDDTWPQINNAGRVVWMGYDGNDWEIYSANADGSGLVKLSNSNYDDEYPQINDSGRVVWHCFRSSSLSSTLADIYSANADGSDLVRITNTAWQDWHPQINNNGTIVWMHHNGSNWDIYTANADGTGVANVTNSAAQDIHPVIDDNGNIFWQSLEKNAAPNDQNPDDDWEILAASGGTIYRLTDNDVDDRAVAVSAAGITWHSDAGPEGQADIYAAPTFGSDDSDGDGLSDTWEMTYFGDLSHTASGDDDVDPGGAPHPDGMTNKEEEQAGTDPTDPNSRLAVVLLASTGAHDVWWSTVHGKTYIVQYWNGSADSFFDPPPTWTDIAESQVTETDGNPGQEGSETWIDDGSSSAGISPTGCRFYRIRLVLE
jgi:Tol biopolymer transport system component